MGLDTLNRMLTLSEITLLSSGRGNAYIECRSETETTLSLILMDAQGRAALEMSTAIFPSEIKRIEFSTSRLAPGHYNAWIEFGGKQFLRSMVIEPINSGDGFFQSIKNWFN